MPSNLVYIPYTALIVCSLAIIFFILYKRRGWGVTKKLLFFIIPLFVMVQLYFWNTNINQFVKSYVFSTEVFVCEYNEVEPSINLPLPERTVFKFKFNGCGTNYVTYIDSNQFETFYKVELRKLKYNNEIKDYNLVKQTGKADSKFEVSLLSGSKISIALFGELSSGKGEITIKHYE